VQEIQEKKLGRILQSMSKDQSTQLPATISAASVAMAQWRK